MWPAKSPWEMELWVCPEIMYKLKANGPSLFQWKMVPLIYVGLRFAVREGGKTIAAGVISEVLPNEESDKTLGFVKKQKAKE